MVLHFILPLQTLLEYGDMEGCKWAERKFQKSGKSFGRVKDLSTFALALQGSSKKMGFRKAIRDG